MKKRQAGLMVFGFLFFVLISFGLSWAQNPPTLLIVVRASDDSLWKMTCDEGSCSSFSSFPGMFAYQPTVTWDEATQEWVVVGTASDSSIWMATFDKNGNFNNDWQSLPGQTASAAGVSTSLYKLGGDIKSDRWLNDDSNTFIGVGVVGAGKLSHNSWVEGWFNTAFGYQTLHSNTTGSSNTATGYHALFSNKTGTWNIATGIEALYSNISGWYNTATGAGALSSNTGGSSNTANGNQALALNTDGYGNTASGQGALYSNTTGQGNTASGISALYSNTTGYNNTAIGTAAGFGATTGNNNIYIGSYVSGTPDDSDVIRIGSVQTQTYVAGIYGSAVGTASPVYVNSSGRLGMSTSSRRFKEEISDMGESSSRLMVLRPVTFKYKSKIDREERPLQYGLIAEEVAEVYPELVQFEKDGEPFSVRYHELGPMLLNEVQKQAEQIKKLNRVLDEKDVRIQKIEKLLEAVQERIALIENPTSTIASK